VQVEGTTCLEGVPWAGDGAQGASFFLFCVERGASLSRLLRALRGALHCQGKGREGSVREARMQQLAERPTGIDGGEDPDDFVIVYHDR
jgi:hypothetical protein